MRQDFRGRQHEKSEHLVASTVRWDGRQRQRVAQEERARRSVQDVDDEDDHCWTQACEGIAKMLKVFGEQRSHEGEHERIEGTSPVSERVKC